MTTDNVYQAYVNLWLNIENGTLSENFFKLREEFRKIRKDMKE